MLTIALHYSPTLWRRGGDLLDTCPNAGEDFLHLHSIPNNPKIRGFEGICAVVFASIFGAFQCAYKSCPVSREQMLGQSLFIILRTPSGGAVVIFLDTCPNAGERFSAPALYPKQPKG
ncbi:hypothetical protein AVEN_256269-1 [Araneus ventricosus]|uniref:Uncharacterized protein n=1 Tax=Araneus ventricosus TaxID=182803 RepID=A0A4Y2RDB2_ARAVE|nr:hypothetical protein AVEN_256269-1 [Araneus ventricosus]